MSGCSVPRVSSEMPLLNLKITFQPALSNPSLDRRIPVYSAAKVEYELSLPLLRLSWFLQERYNCVRKEETLVTVLKTLSLHRARCFNDWRKAKEKRRQPSRDYSGKWPPRAFLLIFLPTRSSLATCRVPHTLPTYRATAVTSRPTRTISLSFAPPRIEIHKREVQLWRI